MKEARILRIVVASPRDVQAERDLLPGIIDELNRGVAADRGLRLELSRWEIDAYPGFHLEGPQGLIDPTLRVEDCDILIGIFWKRFGTPIAGAGSGTEHEFKLAYGAWKQQGSPQIMIYFNKSPYSPTSIEELNQWREVFRFRGEFPREGLWWEYNDTNHFKDLARNHLTSYIRRSFPNSPPEHRKVVAESHLVENVGRSIEELTGAYREQLAGRVGKVYLFGQHQACELEKVFVELNIIEDYQRPIHHAEYLGLLDAELRKRRDLSAQLSKDREDRTTTESKERRTIKPAELLGKHSRVVITGAPGCGKTTLMKYLAWETLKKDQQSVVFLEVKSLTEDDFKEAKNKLAEILFLRAIDSYLDLAGSERESLRKHFFRRLAAGEVAILLDGLDEVSGTDLYEKLCSCVREFAQSAYRNNTVIVSTRPYALPGRIEGFEQMEIAPMSLRHVEEFITHYYGDDPGAKSLTMGLRQRGELRELIRVPFLLGVIVELHRTQHKIESDRLELYRQIVLDLVVKLDREKLSRPRRFRVRDETGGIKLEFLRHLACERLLGGVADPNIQGQEATRLIFRMEELVEEAKRFVKQEYPAVAAQDLAADVVATPLLREVGNEVYAFAHLTLQEYLAAEGLIKRSDYERMFCAGYFNPTIAEMEVLPMTLALLGSRAERMYEVLEDLPESVVYTNLRLRARGLAYRVKACRGQITKLVGEMKRFLSGVEIERQAYSQLVTGSFTGAGDEFTDVAVDELKLLLKDEDSYVRVGAASALGKVGGERAVGALVGAMKDKDSLVRESAAEALGKLADKTLANGLAESLSVIDDFVRRVSAQVIGYYNSEPEIIEQLTALANKDKAAEVRSAAKEALAKLENKRRCLGLSDT